MPALAIARAANEIAADAEHLRQSHERRLRRHASMEQRGELSATQAKTVLSSSSPAGETRTSIATAKGFEQLSSDSLGDDRGER